MKTSENFQLLGGDAVFW